MKRSLPRTPDGWVLEIRLALKDARETEPFGRMIGQPITDTNLFHLAPLVCREADRVTATALANSVPKASSTPWKRSR